MNSDQMIADFNAQFAEMMDSFMAVWGDYIGDESQLDMLITGAFDEWAEGSFM